MLIRLELSNPQAEALYVFLGEALRGIDPSEENADLELRAAIARLRMHLQMNRGGAHVSGKSISGSLRRARRLS